MPAQEQKQRDLDAIICDGNAKLLVARAEELAERLIDLPRHQIRRFFGTVRQIQHTWQNNPKKAQRDLLLLKPKLAYQKRRIKEIKELEEVLSYAITLVGLVGEDKERKERFNNFVDFFEAIVAYHTPIAKKD
ncbi:type III-A CRISPR-associated protein Csm2 [Dehalococcoidales bacterium]|nr:type III-A CRISPR-associated protein Csm2 [Dehalococcoidales bacterium]